MREGPAERGGRDGAHTAWRVRPPLIEAPQELVVCELELDGERFALLAWPTASASASPLAGLTRAEAEVALLAAAGRSNPQIAAARGAASRTVANQLASAFRKLRIRSRAELCARLSGGAAGAPGGEA